MPHNLKSKARAWGQGPGTGQTQIRAWGHNLLKLFKKTLDFTRKPCYNNYSKGEGNTEKKIPIKKGFIMKTLEKIKKFAEENQLMFRDYRFDSLINAGEEVECRYELIYPNTFASFKKFNNQEEIKEFLFKAPKKFELAEKIRMSDTWDMDTLEEFCKLAGYGKEWKEANGDNFVEVVDKAADFLGVRIYR